MEAKSELQSKYQIGLLLDVWAGGYTHERHKQNFFILQKAGNLFQLTGEVKYADYVKKVLLAYADLYPTLDLHPSTKSYARGKLFWQCLNDANWLVYMAQAYDAIAVIDLNRDRIPDVVTGSERERRVLDMQMKDMQNKIDEAEQVAIKNGKKVVQRLEAK